MKITKENVIDMAWKTEGLRKVMQSKDDAKTLAEVQLFVLTDLGMQENPDQEKINCAYKVMELFAEEYNFDSGKRKYGSI